MSPPMTKGEFRKVAKEVRTTSFLDPREYLDTIYVRLKAHTAAYTYFDFAEHLGFGHCNVIYAMIRGRRPLSDKTGLKIVSALELTGLERRYFVAMVSYNNETDPLKREEIFRRMLELKEQSFATVQQRLQMEFLSEWYHPVILEMFGLPQFQDDPVWIANHLRQTLRVDEVKKALALLVDLGYLALDPVTGKHTRVSENLSSGDEVDGMAVVRYHQQMIELSKESITRVPGDERDISAITVSTTAANRALIKAEIQQFRKRILALAQAGEGEREVVQMNIQLFPLTKKGPGDA